MLCIQLLNIFESSYFLVLWWLGHVVRRDNEYVGKQVRRMWVGRRKRGRPRRRREDCVKEDMKERGISESDAWGRVE